MSDHDEVSVAAAPFALSDRTGCYGVDVGTHWDGKVNATMPLFLPADGIDARAEETRNHDILDRPFRSKMSAGDQHGLVGASSTLGKAYLLGDAKFKAGR